MTVQRASPVDSPSPGRGAVLAAVLATAGAVLLAAPAPAAHAQQQEGEEAETPDREATYEVHEGDTLWDLAGEFLSDPFEWQRIYQANQDRIDDPHWIYPGQRFLIPGRDGTVTAVRVTEGKDDGGEDGDAGEGAGRPADRGDGADGTAEDPFQGPSIFDHNPEQGVTVGDLHLNQREPPPLVSASDFYRSSFVADWSEVRPRGSTARLISENPLGLEIPPSVRLRNRVVLFLNGLDVQPGDTLQAVRPGASVDDRRRIVHSLGLVEIENVRGDSARAVVIDVFGDYQEGHPVIPAESYTVADRRSLREAGGQLQGRVLGLAVDQALVSTGDHVYLTVGGDDGVAVGDEFAVYPSGVDNPDTAPFTDRLGTVRVVRVRPGSATARVVGTQDVGIEAGLRVQRMREPVAAGG